MNRFFWGNDIVNNCVNIVSVMHLSMKGIKVGVRGVGDEIKLEIL